MCVCVCRYTSCNIWECILHACRHSVSVPRRVCVCALMTFIHLCPSGRRAACCQRRDLHSRLRNCSSFHLKFIKKTSIICHYHIGSNNSNTKGVVHIVPRFYVYLYIDLSLVAKFMRYLNHISSIWWREMQFLM